MSIFHTVHDSSLTTIECTTGEIVRVGYDEMPECPLDWDVFGASACRRVDRHHDSDFLGDDDTVTAYRDHLADIDEWENEVSELANEKADDEGVDVFDSNWNHTPEYMDIWQDVVLHYRPMPECPVIVRRSGECEAIVNKVQPDFMRGVVLADLAHDVLETFEQWADGEVYMIEVEHPNGDTDVIGGIYGDMPTTEQDVQDYL
ncbi:gp96 [Corynebacterium phage P1201]|uniref:Gp96 n=1 Tax=Corynebacterium phage P1201 TaxID=384848 RepID=A7IYG3_9CAUD|nr:gp96 [Corynebacterium phage P1201]ABF57546.1 gp96 [Corynebacterium phage P1201]